MAGFENPEFEESLYEERLRLANEQLEAAELSAEVYQEALRDAVAQYTQMEDIGWELPGVPKGRFGNDLLAMQRIAEKLTDVCDTNPLLRSGKLARNAYLFSQGYTINEAESGKDLSPQQRNLIARADNQAAVFSLAALERIEAERYQSGTVFVLFDRSRKKFQQIPFGEISDLIYDPFDRNVIRYIQRTVTYTDINPRTGWRTPKEEKVWYPASMYEPGPGERLFTKIGDVQVDLSKRMVVSRANLSPGRIFGIPDAYAAAPWALAYSAYLRDGTKVLAALAEWTWKISPKKRSQHEKAAAVVRTARGAGGTMITDADVQAMPKANAVDLTTGRPLASQVAAVVSIPITILLADPGQGGAYGVAETLSDPSRRAMQARRELNTEFLLECVRLLGARNPAVTWAKMAPGSDSDEMTLVSQAWGTGLFRAEEIRPVMAQIAHIELAEKDAPDGVLLPNNEANQVASTQKADGSNDMSNGVGRDSLGLGAVSRSSDAARERTNAARRNGAE